MKNNNTKVDCTTTADQCGANLADSAQADYRCIVLEKYSVQALEGTESQN
jgi:hypothetical protein